MSALTFVPRPQFPKAFFNIYPKLSVWINPAAMSNCFTLQMNYINMYYSARFSFFYTDHLQPSSME